MPVPTKTLYLVRHAKSSWSDPSLGDQERPLNSRGRKNAPVMGQRMREHGFQPELFISSPAARARETTALITAALDLEDTEVRIEQDLYFNGVEGMLRVVEKVDDRYASVMMTGHNPTMTDLVNQLTGTRIWNIPTCGVSVVELEMESWGLIQSTAAKLAGYDTPKGTGKFSELHGVD